MDILIKILQFILSFSLLVIIHEFGHFLFARLFKTRVEKFYLFFNPWFSLFKFKKGGTEYGIGWIPFGGYVKIAGMIDESMDTDQMKQPVQPYEFRAKPAWQRLLIMVGGVLMNILLAVFIYIGMSYTWGKTYLDNKDVKYGYVYNDLAREMGFRNGDKIVDIDGEAVEDAGTIWQTIVIDRRKPSRSTATDSASGSTFRKKRSPSCSNRPISRRYGSRSWSERRSPGDPAAQAGLLAGDTLVSFNGESMRYFDQYRQAFETYASDTVTLGVMRDSAGITRLITLPVKVSEKGTIGVYPVSPASLLALSTHRYNFWQAIPAGIQRTGSEISSYAKQIKLMFTPKTEAYKSLGGVIAIGNIFPNYWSWEQFWRITAFLVGRSGCHEYPADSGAGRRTRIVPTGRSNHRATTER